MPADSTPNSELCRNPKQQNLKFLQSKYSLSTAEFSNFKIFIIQSLRNMLEGKGMLVRYKKKYDPSYSEWNK